MAAKIQQCNAKGPRIDETELGLAMRIETAMSAFWYVAFLSTLVRADTKNVLASEAERHGTSQDYSSFSWPGASFQGLESLSQG